MNSFLQGRKAIDNSLPKAARKPVVSPAWACKSQGSEPSVEVVKEGDKIVRLVFTCSCGERTEVECLYPAG